MRFVTKNGVTVIKFKALDHLSHINHTVSTRLGGVSEESELASLNLGTHTDDDFENVRENYRRFCLASGYDVNKLVLSNQTHSDNVLYVTSADAGKGVFKERDYTDVDALVTDEKNLPLVIHTADCVPVSFSDIKGRAIGNAHCGWRGTYKKLAEKTVGELNRLFGVNPQNLVCTIGPAICKNCYEVSKDLFEDFQNKFCPSEYLIEKDGKYYIDLLGLNYSILVGCGVKKENITISDICTCENTDILYSHRGQGPKRGIFASVIELI